MFTKNKIATAWINNSISCLKEHIKPSMIMASSSNQHIWKDLGGKNATSIAVGNDGRIYYTNKKGQAWTQDPKTKAWKNIGGLRHISVGSDGRIVGISNINDTIWTKASVDAKWGQISGRLVKITVGKDGRLYGVNRAGSMYTRISLKGSWKGIGKLNGFCVSISAAENGMVYAINRAGQVYSRNGPGGKWIRPKRRLSVPMVSAGNNNGFYLANKKGYVTGKKSVHGPWGTINNKVQYIHYGKDGKLYMINPAGKIMVGMDSHHKCQSTKLLVQEGTNKCVVNSGLCDLVKKSPKTAALIRSFAGKMDAKYGIVKSTITKVLKSCGPAPIVCKNKTFRKTIQPKWTAKNRVLKGNQHAGGHGGSCTCPNGQSYWVGDNKDSCRSLACVGGRSGKCNHFGGPWSKRKVVCGSKTAKFVNTRLMKDRKFKGKKMGGGHGGRCTCPNGKTYNVGDLFHGCRALACIGGRSGTCNHRGGPWSQRRVVCAPKTVQPRKAVVKTTTKKVCSAGKKN